MKELTIGEVARQTGFPSSTLRYYESVGLIHPAGRSGGQRRYHPEVINRLAVIETAQQVGFSVAFIGQLLENFENNGTQLDGTQSDDTQPARWEKLARQKMAELDQLIAQARWMQEILGKLIDCECPDLNECGQRLLEQKQPGLSVHTEGSTSAGRRSKKPAAKA